MSASTKTIGRDAAVGAMILAAVLLFAYMAARIGTVGGYRNGRELTMVFEDATGLVETAPIAISGVKVGVVTSIRYADGGAKVRARIEPDVKIFADATASVRSKSLLGEKLVALDPGTESAGPLPDGAAVKTLPTSDIERMAAAFARAAEAMDPEDVKAIVHGLAVALGDGKAGAGVPEAIRQVGEDLHRLSAALEHVTGDASTIAKDLRPILARLDDTVAKAGKTLDTIEPAARRFDSVTKRLDSLLAKADSIDKEELKRELRKILVEEGVYVRMRPKKVKDAPDTADDAPGLERKPAAGTR